MDGLISNGVNAMLIGGIGVGKSRLAHHVLESLAEGRQDLLGGKGRFVWQAAM
jgi:hypothetical protein